jgi:hypothetical protein
METSSKVFLGVAGLLAAAVVGATLYFTFRKPKDPVVKELDSHEREVPFNNEPSPITAAQTSTPTTSAGNGTDGNSAFESRPKKDSSLEEKRRIRLIAKRDEIVLHLKQQLSAG